MKSPKNVLNLFLLFSILVSTPLLAQQEQRVSTLSNIPEFKVDYPYLLRRTSKVALYYRIDKKTNNLPKAALEAIEQCAKGAVAAGILVGIDSSNLSVGTAAMKAYVKNCLVAKFKDLFSIQVYTKKEYGTWKKV